MLFVILSGFVLAFFAPWINRVFGEKAGWVLALLPAGIALWLARFFPPIIADEQFSFSYAWIPSLDISLNLHLDGLSLLFALLISVIGASILVYGGGYLREDRDIGKFYAYLLAFMASMLGLVLSDNLIGLFIFWELTSVMSFMLIGYYHDVEEYRNSAHQSFMVTFAGGLMMTAGLVVLAMIAADSGLNGEAAYSLQAILALEPGVVSGHSLYPVALLLLLGGCFTKSAQFPFHIWLPNAMAGPTPVSAYLHSATMVKAGIYLLARLQPALGSTELWVTLLPLVGAFTMFLGMFLAVKATDLKQILAYSTIMALGTLTMLLGIGTETAMVAFVSFLLAHAMYKAALFMIVGIVDRQTGTRDIRVLSGLRKKMPITATVAALAALSLGGLPPLLGFVGKELMFEAALEAPRLAPLVALLTVLAAFLGIVVAAKLGLGPFWGEEKPTPKTPGEVPVSKLLGPVVLTALSLLFGMVPVLPDYHLIQPAVPRVLGRPVDFELALWHGINTPLILSFFTLSLGALAYIYRDQLVRSMGRLQPLYDHGPEWIYRQAMDRGLPALARGSYQLIQNGSLRFYVALTFLSFVVPTAWLLFSREGVHFNFQLSGSFHHLVIAILLVAAGVYAAVTPSRLAAVASAGVVGLATALFYLLFSAPDLAITQALIEALVAILLVLLLARLPRFAGFSSSSERLRDLVVALSVGLTVTAMLLYSFGQKFYDEPISIAHLLASAPLAKGRNVVNVILVDFRGFDTLGEATVLSLAGIGVWAMLKFRPRKGEKS